MNVRTIGLMEWLEIPDSPRPHDLTPTKPFCKTLVSVPARELPCWSGAKQTLGLFVMRSLLYTVTYNGLRGGCAYVIVD